MCKICLAHSLYLRRWTISSYFQRLLQQHLLERRQEPVSSWCQDWTVLLQCTSVKTICLGFTVNTLGHGLRWPTVPHSLPHPLKTNYVNIEYFGTNLHFWALIYILSTILPDFQIFFILHCCWGIVAYEQLSDYKNWVLMDSWLYYRSNEYKLLIF